MDISSADIKLILSTLQESGFDTAEVVIGDVKIAVARNGHQLPTHSPAPGRQLPSVQASPADVATAAIATPAPAAAAAAPTVDSSATASSENAHVVESPSVGVFWRAPSPGAAPFVEIGQEVSAGDTIGIVEVMKLMNNVAAGVDGVVTAVHADNAGAVEFGTPLVSIEPKA